MSRVRMLLASATLVATTALASSSALAVCIPENFPVNWLRQQERAHGHTIRRHVGKTDRQLTDRLRSSPRLLDANSYPNSVPFAQQTITTGLASDAGAINAWALRVGNAQPEAFDFADANGNTVGRIARRNPTPPPFANISNTCAYRAVLKPTGGGNCYLLTSYPIMPRPEDNCRP